MFLPSRSSVSLNLSVKPSSRFLSLSSAQHLCQLEYRPLASKMAALTKRTYSAGFLTSLRPSWDPRIETTSYNTLKSIDFLGAPRGVRAGTRVKQRAALSSPQRIHTVITTHQHVQLAKYGAGHLVTNCINIPTGTRITSKVPTFLITKACHVTNKVDELHGVVEMNNAAVTIVTESWLTDSVPSTAISIGQSFKDVRANCFCASLLRTQIHLPRHATSCIERARYVLK